MSVSQSKRAVYRPENFTGCRVIVKDAAEDKELLDSTILDHNLDFNTIRVLCQVAGTFERVSQVSLIVFTNKGLFFYHGTIFRSFYANSTEIALFRGENVENRGSPRFPLPAPGSIDSIVIAEQAVVLRTPLLVNSVNISSTGILITTLPEAFTLGQSFRVTLDVDGYRAPLFCRVVRILRLSHSLSQFGCTFI